MKQALTIAVFALSIVILAGVFLKDTDTVSPDSETAAPEERAPFNDLVWEDECAYTPPFVVTSIELGDENRTELASLRSTVWCRDHHPDDWVFTRDTVTIYCQDALAYIADEHDVFAYTPDAVEALPATAYTGDRQAIAIVDARADTADVLIEPGSFKAFRKMVTAAVVCERGILRPVNVPGAQSGG